MIQLKSINKRYLHEHVLKTLLVLFLIQDLYHLLGQVDVEKVLYFILLLDLIMITQEK